MTTFWKKDMNTPSYPTLHGEIQTDTAIIGGGLCGVLTAYLLKEQGIDCVVLEAASIGSGQTMGTTAKITSQHGLCYHNLIQTHGRKIAKCYAAACRQAVTDYSELIHSQNISCSFEQCPTYLYSTCENTLFLMAEANDAEYLGFDAAYTDKLSLPFPVTGAVRFNHQAAFHPLQFLYALSRELTIYEHSRVLSVKLLSSKEQSSAGFKNMIGTEYGTVSARRVIFACHYPFLRYPGFYALKMFQKQNPVFALQNVELPEAPCLGVDPDGLSFRPAGEFLLLGGPSYRTGDSKSAAFSYALLKQRVKELYPNGHILESWTAQDCVTLDGLPMIGIFSKSRPEWCIADGFGKWGMTGSMLAATLLRDMFTGQKNPLEQIVFPGRFLRHASFDFLWEHISVFTSSLLLSRLKKPKVVSDDLQTDEGGIVLHQGKKTAAYRNADGKLYTFLPRCPHMGCELSWNAEAKTWDCPCHGSRFRYDGTLLCGPANLSLTPLPQEK
ncbi:MAG: FAD-dependent oxidoreductase [Clostridiales bacterium]|nr:FAD-dependent oxidoreductase [Clostridiales bacterium]